MKKFKLPGFRSTFTTDSPIIPGGHFTWGEALHYTQLGGAIRIPKHKLQVENILKLARHAEKARAIINRPMYIISWYRDFIPPKGVKNSQHLVGAAMDFYVDGMSGRALYNLLNPHWVGGLGCYPDRPKTCHIDVGPNRRW